MNRGNVVTVDFSRYDPTDKVRPALVVQNDRDNTRMTNSLTLNIVANFSNGRVALGGCPPRAPTDPYVDTFDHTVPRSWFRYLTYE